MALRSAPPGFNSTLVQLKAPGMVSVVSGKVCFNSTLVQLKGDRTLKNGPMSTCFNSTLVQLKDFLRKV